MIAWAEAEFRRCRPQPDGAALGDHEDAAARQWAALGRKPKRSKRSEADAAAVAEFPSLIGYVWIWFGEILAGVAPNGMVPAAIGWRDLSDWVALTGERPEPWEARLLIALSVCRLNVLMEKQSHGNSHDVQR